MRLVRRPVVHVPGSNTGANGIIGRVLNIGGPRVKPNPFPGYRTPNPPPPGSPTGRGTITG